MLPPVLLFLNLGATELLVVLALVLLLFGADSLPSFARRMGRWQAQLGRYRREFSRQMETSTEKEARKLLAFEQQRERQVKTSDPHVQEEARLRDAARSLDIPGADSADLVTLKKRLRDKVADGDASGER